MLSYIAKRLLGVLPTLVIVGALVFLFVHVLPGDPARLAAGPDATPETPRPSPPPWSHSAWPPSAAATTTRRSNGWTRPSV